MNKHHTLFIMALLISLFLFGCQSSADQKNTDPPSPIQINHHANNSNETQHQVNKKIDQYLSETRDDIAKYQKILLPGEVFIAIQTTTMKQLNERNIEEEVTKELKDVTGLEKIHVSSDEKFYIELNKLMDKNWDNEEELKKELDRLKKLKKEKT